MERTFVNVGIQVCPKGTWATEREAKLRRKKFILRKRLQRREEAIKLMRNIIGTLKKRVICVIWEFLVDIIMFSVV